jgi:hypothetical protein
MHDNDNSWQWTLYRTMWVCGGGVHAVGEGGWRTCHVTVLYWHFMFWENHWAYLSWHVHICDRWTMYRHVSSALYSAGLVGHGASIFCCSSGNHTSHQLTKVASSLHSGQQLSQQRSSVQQTHYPWVSTRVLSHSFLWSLCLRLFLFAICHLLPCSSLAWLVLCCSETSTDCIISSDFAHCQYSERNTFWKVDISVLGQEVGEATVRWLYGLRVPPSYPRMEKHPVSKICWNSRQRTKFRNLVIPRWIKFIVFLLGTRNQLPKVKPSWSHGWGRELHLQYRQMVQEMRDIRQRRK